MLPNLIASLFALVLTSGGAAPGALPSAYDAISVLSSSAEVRFPDEVVFRMEAESESDITSVKLFYRLGNLNVTSYAYPDFQPSNRVSAGYRLRTGGNRYIPAGVDIKYHYEITNMDGHVHRTEPAVLKYLDDRYDWKTVATDSLLVVYHDRAEGEVARVARAVALRMQQVQSLLGLDEVPPMKAVILNSSREASRTFPLVSQTARSSHTFGGFAYGEYDMFVLRGLRLGGMVHEATHLLVDEALDSPFAQVPAWLNEGLAMYFEPGSGNRRAALERAVRAGETIPLRHMYSVPGRPTDVVRFYAQARNVVAYMIDELGSDRMTALLQAINSGEDIDEATRTAYGLSLDRLDARWRGWLLGVPQPELAPVNWTAARSRDRPSSTPTAEDERAQDIPSLEEQVALLTQSAPRQSDAPLEADTLLTPPAPAGSGPAASPEGASFQRRLPAIAGGTAAAVLVAGVTGLWLRRVRPR